MDHLNSVIFPFGIENRDKLGYTTVLVNKDYILESIYFNEGKFNRKNFRKLKTELDNPQDDNVKDIFNLYFEILYESDHTKVMFYRPFMMLSTSDYSRFKL
jgi:hypothetical protein